MARQALDLTPGAGDTLPDGGTKVNSNFSELYTRLGGDTLPTLTSGTVVFVDGSGNYTSATGFKWGTATGQGLTLAAGTATTDVNALSVTQTWNAAGVTFTGVKWTITDTASASGSLAFQILGGASGTTDLLKLTKAGDLQVGDGSVTAPALAFASTSGLGFYRVSSSSIGFANGSGTLRAFFGDAVLGQIGASPIYGAGDSLGFEAAIAYGKTSNSWVFGSGNTTTTGSATTRTCINKAVSSIADNTATTVFTVTVPNAAHSASIRVRLVGSLGAGGAIGANEATGEVSYFVSVARTAGVNAVANISTAIGSVTSSVAGGATVTVTGTLGAVSGAAGASNTFTIQVTVARGSGSSTNHTCLGFAELLNANATGVTIA